MHVRAKFSRIGTKFQLLNAELATQVLFHICGTFEQSFFFLIYHVFIAISYHNSAQKFIKLNSDSPKKYTFRRSDDPHKKIKQNIVVVH